MSYTSNSSKIRLHVKENTPYLLIDLNKNKLK